MRVLHFTMESHSSISALEETAYHANHFVPGIAAIAAVVFSHSATTQAQNTKLIPQCFDTFLFLQLSQNPTFVDFQEVYPSGDFLFHDGRNLSLSLSQPPDACK